MAAGLRFGALPAPLRSRISARIVLLTVLFLSAMVLTFYVTTADLRRNLERVQEANERFFMLQTAAEARNHFGELRYWMTDLSVSLLTLSERRANEARAAMAADLEKIAHFAPDATAAIQAEVAAYFDEALEAADAYTAGNRIVGNSRLATARQHSDKVDRALAELTERVRIGAERARQAAEADAETSVRRAAIVTVAITAMCALLTVLVLRSILGPLARLDRAMAALTKGDEAVDLPPSGDDEFGRMARTLGLLRDAQAEGRRLRESAQRQREIIETAIETIPDGFVIYDAEDRIILVNRRYHALLPEIADVARPGATFEQVLRAHVAHTPAITRGEDAEAWIARRLSVHHRLTERVEEAAMGDAWVRIARRRTPDGGVVAVYSDITDLMRRNSELEIARRESEVANHAKSAFLATMSHELRTPLNAIIGYSEMLIEDAADVGGQSLVPDLEKIGKSGRHLLSLINDILDLSKIEAGKTELYYESVDLREMIGEIAATLDPLMAQRGNRLVVGAQPDDAMMETDRTKLRQILFNLLSNANKFSERSEVTLDVRRLSGGSGDRFEFVVQDRGIGIRPEQMEKLFQPFVQAEASTTRDFGGTGLGLAITDRFARLMGGGVTVSSVSGAGSAFTVTLPAAPGTATPEPAEPPQGEGPLGKVLVIDDDEQARASLAATIGAAGYGVDLAASGAAGLAMARERAPDVIVLDVIMPEQDGWSVLRALKADEALCDVPVLLATAVADRDLGAVFGAAEHLVKPIAPERLLAALERLIGEADRDVLVVDDDAATRELFRRTLMRAGWRVRLADDGVAAMREIAAARPALLLLDLMMPNMDGFEVMRRLGEAGDLEHLQTVIVTSKDLTREESEWLRSRSADVVEKGVTGRADLLAAIKRRVAPLKH